MCSVSFLSRRASSHHAIGWLTTTPSTTYVTCQSYVRLVWDEEFSPVRLFTFMAKYVFALFCSVSILLRLAFFLLIFFCCCFILFVKYTLFSHCRRIWLIWLNIFAPQCAIGWIETRNRNTLTGTRAYKILSSIRCSRWI